MANIVTPTQSYDITSELVILLAQIHLEMRGILTFNPVLDESDKWLRWMAVISPTTCQDCFDKNGTIYEQCDDVEAAQKNAGIPMHPNCKCYLDTLTAVIAGTATMDGEDGADYWIENYGQLPATYVTKDQAESKGWNSRKGNLKDVLPTAVIGGDIYKNKDGKLPDAPGRIWYEADINYTGGYRNNDRILYSNDGLLFVTYSHYYTFYEIK